MVVASLFPLCNFFTDKNQYFNFGRAPFCRKLIFRNNKFFISNKQARSKSGHRKTSLKKCCQQIADNFFIHLHFAVKKNDRQILKMIFDYIKHLFKKVFKFTKSPKNA